MECLCGCGTGVPKRLVPTNIIAFLLALEIAEWDRFRVLMREATGEGTESTDVFVSDGMFCYDRSLAVLHGQALHSTPRDTKKWMKFSRKQRKKLAKKTGLIDGGKDVEPTEDRLANLDLQQPDESYSGEEPLARFRTEVKQAKEAP